MIVFVVDITDNIFFFSPDWMIYIIIPMAGRVRRQAAADQPVRQVHALQRARPVEETDHRDLHRRVLRLSARAGPLCGALTVRASPVNTEQVAV